MSFRCINSTAVQTCLIHSLTVFSLPYLILSNFDKDSFQDMAQAPDKLNHHPQWSYIVELCEDEQEMFVFLLNEGVVSLNYHQEYACISIWYSKSCCYDGFEPNIPFHTCARQEIENFKLWSFPHANSPVKNCCTMLFHNTYFQLLPLILLKNKWLDLTHLL